MRLPWTKRWKLDKAHKRAKEKLEVYTSLHYHLSISLALANKIFGDHPGCNGVRCLLEDSKGPIETLKKLKSKIEGMLEVKQQSE